MKTAIFLGALLLCMGIGASVFGQAGAVQNPSQGVKSSTNQELVAPKQTPQRVNHAALRNAGSSEDAALSDNTEKQAGGVQNANLGATGLRSSQGKSSSLQQAGRLDESPKRAQASEATQKR